jgi:hypothetical protein
MYIILLFWIGAANLRRAIGGYSENPDLFRGKNIGVTIARGNVDFDRLPWIKATGDKH